MRKWTEEALLKDGHVTSAAIEAMPDSVMLVDLDKEGKKLYGRLRHDLMRHRVKIDDKFREFLFKETKLRQIEGLRRYLDRL